MPSAYHTEEDAIAGIQAGEADICLVFPEAGGVLEVLKNTTSVQSLEYRLDNMSRTLQIGDAEMSLIGEMLRENRSIKFLRVASSADVTTGWAALAAGLADNVGLQDLHIDGISFGDAGCAEALAAAFGGSNRRVLHLQATRLGDAGAGSLLTALASNSNLVELHLSKNRIGDAGAEAVAAYAALSGRLERLNLVGNEIGDAGAKVLATYVRASHTLCELHMGNNRVCEAGAEAVLAAIATSACIRVLDMDRVESVGAHALLQACLDTTCRLQKLHLSDANIGDPGAEALGAGLKVSSSIRELDLTKNSIGVAGVEALAAGLLTNRSLEQLVLARNHFGDAGVVALGASLKVNNTLEELNVRSCSIGNVGMLALAAGIKENTGVQYILLFDNREFSAEGCEALEDALKHNDTLSKIGLSAFSVPEEAWARIKGRVEVVKEQYRQFGVDGLQLLQGNAKVCWGRAKLMVVGKGAAGKSSTIRTLLWQPPVAEHDSTIGVDLKLTRTRDWAEREADVADLDEQLAKAQFQSAKSTRPETIMKRNHRESQATAAATASEAGPGPEPAEAPTLKVNEEEVAKCYRADLKARVEEDDGKTVAEEISFTIWDYGGQDVFYALHHLFLTSNGVYVLVFDMRELLGRDRFKDALEAETYDAFDSVEGALASLLFWLGSIELHAPDADVVLVGTYMDAVSSEDDLEAVNELLESIGVDENEQVEENRPERLWFFPVDNMDRSDAALGRAQRVRDVVVARVKDSDYVKREVPLRWALLLDMVLEDKDRNYMELEAVKKLCMEECGIGADEVTTQLLPFLHELGVVVHLTATPTLADMVVTRPQWLLDNLSRVICDPRHMRAHVDKLRDEIELPKSRRKDLRRWEKDAVATRDLLEWLWQGRNVDYFVDLMQEMLLGSVVDVESGALLVPSLLPPAPSSLSAASFDGPLAYVQFEFLPKGVFQRFVTSMSLLFGKELVMRNVYADAAVLVLDNVEVLLTADAASKRVRFRFQQSDADAGCVPDRARLVQLAFGKIDDTFMKAKTQPRLFLSADGSDDDDACAALDQLTEAQDKGNDRLMSLSNHSLQTTAFAYFFQKSEKRTEADGDASGGDNLLTQRILRELGDVKKELKETQTLLGGNHREAMAVMDEHHKALQRTVLSVHAATVPPLWVMTRREGQGWRAAATVSFEVRMLCQLSGACLHADAPVTVTFPSDTAATVLRKAAPVIKATATLLKVGSLAAKAYGLAIPIGVPDFLASVEVPDFIEELEGVAGHTEKAGDLLRDGMDGDVARGKAGSRTKRGLDDALQTWQASDQASGLETCKQLLELARCAGLSAEDLVKRSGLHRVVSPGGDCVWMANTPDALARAQELGIVDASFRLNQAGAGSDTDKAEAAKAPAEAAITQDTEEKSAPASPVKTKRERGAGPRPR